ncbi:low temperature requirement protein A [Kitasatospora phosalacinea]|uniref:low temperature requirement protein A n=1 Tax=Kitasatospora phosalacinea TaxID=2065 RepID=UPI000691E043|nr:low temperature requirement protein A [Kitasatospora phosalacinea]
MDAENGNGNGNGSAAAEPERHAGWNELFFDLIAVAGVGQLAHLLHSGPDWSAAGLYGLLFGAFWLSWACFTVYGDVVAERTSSLALFLAMAGMAVMAAAVEGVHEDARANAFALAYVLLRWYAGRLWRQGRSLLVVPDWPVAQYGAGAVPWLVSTVAPEAWRYWLWGAGLLVDALLLLVAREDRDRVAARWAARRERRGGGPGARRPLPELREAGVDAAHLGERLGLFMVIVLGEGVVQVIRAASDQEHWDVRLAWTGLAAMTLLASLSVLSVRRGAAAFPQLVAGGRPRRVMLCHAVGSAALAALAAGLGRAVEHADGALPDDTRRLLCAALACYFAVALAAVLSVPEGRGQLRGVLVHTVPAVLLPLLLALLPVSPTAGTVVLLLLLATLWARGYRPGRAG